MTDEAREREMKDFLALVQTLAEGISKSRRNQNVGLDPRAQAKTVLAELDGFRAGLSEQIEGHLETGRLLSEEVCHWVENDDPDMDWWDTDCGEDFCFIDAGPTENKMRFCCYCGKRLKVGRA